MNNMINTEYIAKWIEKSRNEKDCFDKFVYGFFAFNALYSEFYLREKYEKDAIKAFFDAHYDGNQGALKEIFDTPEYEYFCNRAPIRDMRNDTISWRAKDDLEKIREKNTRKSTKAMLMILYQIRCNLFHGDKSFTNLNDQEIMKNASELLLRYNTIFLNDIT